MSIASSLYQIADILQMDVNYDRDLNCLSGKSTRRILLAHGVEAKVCVNIVGGQFFPETGNAMAVVHVAGDVFLVVLAEDKKPDNPLVHVVNGVSSGWSEVLNHHGCLPEFDWWRYWSRKSLYELIAPHVVVTFTGAAQSKKWKVLSEGSAMWENYAAMRAEGVSSIESMNKAIEEDRLSAITKK